jgi:hypothetical protein
VLRRERVYKGIDPIACVHYPRGVDPGDGVGFHRRVVRSGGISTLVGAARERGASACEHGREGDDKNEATDEGRGRHSDALQHDPRHARAHAGLAGAMLSWPDVRDCVRGQLTSVWPRRRRIRS